MLINSHNSSEFSLGEMVGGHKKNLGNNIDVVHKKFLREIFKGTRIENRRSQLH